MCNHPQSNWVGTADGIRCGLCGAPIDLTPKAEPKAKLEPVKDPELEPKKVEKKAAPKKGGKK